MNLSINYEGWKATVSVTDYITGQLPMLRSPPEESEEGWGAEIDYVINSIVNESGDADPMMLFHFDSKGFSESVFNAWSDGFEDSNEPDFDDFDDYMVA